MTCLQRTTYGVVAGGYTLALLCCLLPLASPVIMAHPMLRAAGTVTVATIYAAIVLMMLIPRLSRLRALATRDVAALERSRQALENGNSQLQAVTARLFTVQEDERRAISRDLHDDIGQSVTAIKLSAHAAMNEQDPQRRQKDLGQIVELVDGAITRLRNLSMLLRPPQLDVLGLEAALCAQAEQLFRSSPVELALEVDTLPQQCDDAVGLACFRIAQECLTNAMRHALPSQVRLCLDSDGAGRLRLQVIDDGEGFDPQARPQGLGLVIMRERAQSVGGSLNIDTAPGEGTRVQVCLPYHAREAGHAVP